MAAAAFNGRATLCSLLAEFVNQPLLQPQRWVYGYKSTQKGVMTCNFSVHVVFLLNEVIGWENVPRNSIEA
jgi:hypothetical protein